MFEHEFRSMMPHTIQVQRATGVDQYGKPVHSTTVQSYRGRISGKVLSLRRFMREDNTVVFDIWIDAGDNVFTLSDKVTLPDDDAWQDRTPVIFTIARITDDDGHHHTKLQCGWQYHRQGQ